MHDDFDRRDHDLTDEELRVRIEALSRVLERTANDDPTDSDADKTDLYDDDSDDDAANSDTAALASDAQRRAAAGRILDNLGLRPTDMAATLSDSEISGVISEWADNADDRLLSAGHRGPAAATFSAKSFRISPIPGAAFTGEPAELWAKAALQHPEPDVTRVVAEIVLSPDQTPSADVAIVAAIAVSGKAAPIRTPMVLRNYGLPGGEPMYALVGSASMLYGDLNTVDAITSIQLEVERANTQEAP